MKETIYTVKEVAAKLRVSIWTVRRRLHAGELQGIRVGHQWRIRENALNAYLRRADENEHAEEINGSP